MPHPSLSAKIWISDPGKKSGQCILGSPMPPYSGQGVGILLRTGIQALEIDAKV